MSYVMLMPRKSIHFSVLIFFVCMLFTFVIWNHYFNSPSPIDRGVAANMMLLMGSLFSFTAGLCAWSIESRRDFLEKELEKKRNQLLQKNMQCDHEDQAKAALYESTCLLSKPSLFPLLDSLFELICRVMAADEGSLMLMDSRKQLFIASSRGISEIVARGVQLQLGERVAGIAAKEKREFLLIDGLENYTEFRGIEPDPRIRSSIVCPLICQDQVLGVLNLNRINQKENFGVSDLIHVSIFCSLVAQALMNSSLRTALELKAAGLAPRPKPGAPASAD